MNRSGGLAVSALVAVLAPALVAQRPGSPAKTTQIKSVQDLVAALRARQEHLASASLSMRTRGSYPGSKGYEIRGTLRVLGKTHLHVTTVATFEDAITTEAETVKTPDGVWMREKDPAHGEVFTRMSRELMLRLEQASKLIGKEGGGPVPAASQAEDLLGGAMLESLAKQFDLGLSRSIVDGRGYWVAKGPVREAPGSDEDFGLPAPDAVEILVRVKDLVVTRMVQFSKAKEIMRIEITHIALNEPMSKASFRIPVPPDKRVIDVMEHPPAAAQIRELLDEAAAIRTRREGEKNQTKKARTKKAGTGK